MLILRIGFITSLKNIQFLNLKPKNQTLIEVEDTGGLSERVVIYDTINDTLNVKMT